MKKIHFVLSLIILMSQLSCKEDTELEFSSPNFSTPFIGQINSQGVEFSCEIYDFGKFPIEEYGFMYSSEPVPRPENSEVVRSQGAPTKRFSLVGNHSLEAGKTYYVVAFTKSSRGYTFSESIEFDSQGSKGFTISSIEFPEPLYFMDTIEVIGTGFSNFSENYQVFLENSIEVEVFDTSEKGFKFLLPYYFEVVNQNFALGEMNLNIKVFEKSISTKKTFLFQKPTFNLQNPKTFNFNEEAYLTGKHLYFAKSYPTYIDQDGNENHLYLNRISDDTISMILPSDLDSTNPTIKFTIRDEIYELTNLFTLNPTELSPNQTLNIKSSEGLTVLGQNFNLYFQNKFLINEQYPMSDLFYISQVNEDKVNFFAFDFRSFPELASKLGREFEISAKSLGRFSNYKVKIKMNDVIFPYMKSKFDSDERLLSLQFGEKVYLVRDNNISQIQHRDKTSTMINTNVPNTIGLGNLFVQYIENGKAILGSSTINHPQTTGRIYIFDSNTNSISQLAEFPSQIGTVLGTIYNSGILTVDVLHQNGQQNQFAEKWQLDLNSNIWTSLGQSNNKNSFIDFKANGETYAFKDLNGSGTQISKWDANSQDWISVSVGLSGYWFPYGSQIIDLNGLPSIIAGNGSIIQFDSKTEDVSIKESSYYLNFYSRRNPRTTYVFEEKIYFVESSGYIIEIDLDLL